MAKWIQTLITILIQTIHSEYNYLCGFNTNFTTNQGVNTGNWEFNSTTCEVTQTSTTANGAVAWLGIKPWTDYTIEAVINVKNGIQTNTIAAIIFRAQSISPTGSDIGEYYAATLIYWNNYKFHAIRYSTIGYNILKQLNNGPCNYDQDYLIKIEVSANTYTFYLDNNLIFSVDDTVYLSGSVGLRSSYTKAVFKTLYITFPTNAPTTYVPTSITNSPSMLPTSVPTTSTPTLIPTTFPTVNPTIYPTNIPTIYPTINPTIYPTVNPTIYPTMYFRQYPTVNPTISPTIYPTVSPTIYPSNIPTIVPTIIEMSDSENDAIVMIMIICGCVVVLCIGLIVFYLRRKSIRRGNNMKNINTIQMENLSETNGKELVNDTQNNINMKEMESSTEEINKKVTSEGIHDSEEDMEEMYHNTETKTIGYIETMDSNTMEIGNNDEQDNSLEKMYDNVEQDNSLETNGTIGNDTMGNETVANV